MPDWRDYLRSNLAPLQLGPERELQMVEEMAQHLEAIYEEALVEGASEREAYRRATDHIKDWRLLECELVRSKNPGAGAWIGRHAAPKTQAQKRKPGGKVMGSFGQDLRYGLRMLLKSKGFTLVAVLSLALGIGANTALFTLIDAVLLKMLPVERPNELVLLSWISGPRLKAWSSDGRISTDPASGLRTSTSFSYLAFERIRDNNEALSAVFAFAPLSQLNVSVAGQPEIAAGQLVSGGYYTGLGVKPMLGRTITNYDDKAGASPVAVITHRYWQRRFAQDAQIAGKTVIVNNVPFTIVGVTPPEFFGALQVGESADLSIPMAMQPQMSSDHQSGLSTPWSWWLQIMGRLNPGVTAEQAAASFESTFQQSAEEGWAGALTRFPSQRQAQSGAPRDVPRLRASSGSQGLTELRREYSQPLTILMVIVGLVLLIACANVANLLLARAAVRQKEIAVRLTIGASRWRLIRQLLTESVLLAILGGSVGVAFAYWGKDLLLLLRPWGGGELALDLKLDVRVLGFTIAVSLATGLLFGLAPALRATRVDLTPALKDNSRSVVGGSRSLLNKSLIVVQVAVSLVLVVGAGLFVRTLRNLENVDVGFNRENLLLFSIDPGLSGYDNTQIAQLYRRITERLEAVPGVRSATMSMVPLLSGMARTSGVSVEGHTSQDGESGDAKVNNVGTSFFETMEIPILLGRGLSQRDDELAPKIAVVNQMMARKYFGDDNPIGGRFGFGGPPTAGQIEIIGVARDASYTGLRDQTEPTVYLPYLQSPPRWATFVVRTSGNIASMSSSIRDAVREVDSNLPLFAMKTQSQQIDESLVQERLFASLSSFFGALALALACIGLYGVMSYGVARRTNEIGVRMALGATGSRVTRMVMRETMLVVLIGVVIGFGTAMATTRLVASMLFGIEPTDLGTILFAVLLMIAVAALAGYIPARRASKVDPIIALRYE